MQKPLAVITLSFAAGIVAAKFFVFPVWLCFVLLIIFIALACFALAKKIDLRHLLLLIFFLLGMFLFQVNCLQSYAKYSPPCFVAAINSRFNVVLNDILPSREASLLGSFLLGSNVSPLLDDDKETYRRAGLIHLLVVSGTQVSILIGVSLNVLRALAVPLWLSLIIASILNLLLVLVTGAGASILRAAIMGEIMLVGMLFERQKETYTALSLSALILLLFNPAYLFDLGFQLSFAATWALVYIAPTMEKKIPRMLAITLSPILATFPIVAYNFGQLSFGAVVSNLIVLPWVEFLVILGISTVMLGFFLLPIAKILGGTIWLMLLILDNTAKLVASLPGSCLDIRPPSFSIIIIYYIGLIFVVGKIKRNESFGFTKKKLAFAACLAISLFIWETAFSAPSLGSRELTVSFIDVGQGDSILIQAPGGKNILIDGGNTRAGQRVAQYLKMKGANRLDLVLLTHPDSDHLNGLLTVLKKIKVDQVLDPQAPSDSDSYAQFKQLVAANGAKYVRAYGGLSFAINQNITAEVLGPVEFSLAGTNANSAVLHLSYGKASFLFTGDMDDEEEKSLLKVFRRKLKATVLKVGHHGSKFSSGSDFLEAVAPQYAVISAGRNNCYHHPHLSVLRRLSQVGAKIFRTDREGTIVFKTDGEKMIIVSSR